MSEKCLVAWGENPHIGTGDQNVRGKFKGLGKQSLWDRQRKNTVKTRQYTKGIVIKYQMIPSRFSYSLPELCSRWEGSGGKIRASVTISLQKKWHTSMTGGNFGSWCLKKWMLFSQWKWKWTKTAIKLAGVSNEYFTICVISAQKKIWV